MAQRISDETIEYAAVLAKLELSGGEKEKARQDMEKMLEYIDTLNELDTGGVEPSPHIFSVGNVFREDIVTNGDAHEEMLENAPARKGQSYQVPKTFEG